MSQKKSIVDVHKQSAASFVPVAKILSLREDVTMYDVILMDEARHHVTRCTSLNNSNIPFEMYFLRKVLHI